MKTMVENVRWGWAMNPEIFEESDGWVVDYTDVDGRLQCGLFLTSDLHTLSGFDHTLSDQYFVEFKGSTGEGGGFLKTWRDAALEMDRFGLKWFPERVTSEFYRIANSRRRGQTHINRFRVNDPQLALQFKLSWN